MQKPSLFLAFLASIGAPYTQADEWVCYSPNNTGSSVIATEIESGEPREFSLTASSFLCLEKPLDAGKINLVDFAAGVPFKYIRNRGEYSFSIDPAEFVRVQESGIELLESFQSVSFYHEDGRIQQIFKRQETFQDSFAGNLKAGVNGEMNLLYFFNLEKPAFNYTILLLDPKRKCAWSEWPGIHTLDWDGWGVCSTHPAADKKVNQ
ncbi:hypothetical protein [Microbulbifer yueqingensis]|uniref:Uncharacterized protein n=1 Tax=Microbulbifer yueqingensis TaxID=658219 RepID=A0A1G8V795_9GAMM|nr:hypothetical protein [Microbulbifer yueqingensis]SDJ61893.1 hypothetical protein SAMN05216212_0436 [Microbulbifer yueqingensis]